MSITLNGKQLREVLDFINPDGPDDVDQMEEDVTIVFLAADQAPLDDDGTRMPAGLYAYSTEYPEEGCLGPLGLELSKEA